MQSDVFHAHFEKEPPRPCIQYTSFTCYIYSGKVELGLCLETLASSAATASYVKYCEWNREYYASTQGQNKIRQNVYNMNKLKHKNKHKMKTSAAKVGNNMSNDDIIHTGSDNDAEQHVNINEENRLVASIDGQKNQKKRAHGRKNKAHPSIPLPPSQSLSSISLPSPSFSVPLSTPPRSTPAFSKKTTVSNNSQLVNKISNTKLRELVAGRELLHHLFGRSHQMEMKKIVGWCKPVRILTNAQLGELDSLFHSYEVNAGAGTASTDTDSTIALADFYEHLTEQGLSLKEIKRICKELDINIRDEGRSRVSQHQFMMFYRDIWDLRVNFRINDLRSTRQGAHLETHLNSPKYTQHHGQPYANISMHKSTYRG